jgi:hypothetical protein
MNYLIRYKMVYNEKTSVDPKFDSVADIGHGKENVCIKVRVIWLWKVPAFLNPCECSSLEMVLIDEKVSDFHYNSFLIWLYLIEGYIYRWSYSYLQYVLNNLFWSFYLCFRREKFMFLYGSSLCICLNQSLKRDKFMRCPISQFFHRVVSTAQLFIPTKLCFK